MLVLRSTRAMAAQDMAANAGRHATGRAPGSFVARAGADA